MSYTVLTIIANATLGNTPTGPIAAFPQWTGPDPTLCHIQANLFSSLATSLLAAFVAMLGKQWLNRYSPVDTHGPLIDLSRDRQRKIDGMSSWHFHLVMEILPLILQISLLFLACALSKYLSTTDNEAARVIVGFTVFGSLFYLLIVLAAILSYNCPFQTPLSLLVRFVIRLDDHSGHFKRSGRWFQRMISRMKKQLSPNFGPFGIGVGTVGGQDHIELVMAGSFDHPPTFFDEGVNWGDYVLDSNCIAWMFERSVNAGVILDIIRFISEVVWHAGIRTTPLKRLYDTVLECFDNSSGRPVAIPKLKKKAYLSAKALLHVAIQRMCMGNESDKEAFNYISNRYQNIGSERFGGDSDLESTLGIMDRVFKANGFEKIPWNEFSFTDSHHAWMGHILLYRAWYFLGKSEPLPDEIREFVLYSLQLEPPPPAPIVWPCILIISLVLGISFDADNQQVFDRR
jgi:hypothetical protein